MMGLLCTCHGQQNVMLIECRRPDHFGRFDDERRMPVRRLDMCAGMSRSMPGSRMFRE